MHTGGVGVGGYGPSERIGDLRRRRSGDEQTDDQCSTTDHAVLAVIVGPLIGPLVAMATFVCSVGNVPRAAVLWNGGISFGGVISFLFADLLIVPILLIYRRYHGKAMLLRLVAFFYLASVAAGYLVELVFGLIGLLPEGTRHAETGHTAISWNYTSVLNIVFAVVAAVLVGRFLVTGGRAMHVVDDGR